MSELDENLPDVVNRRLTARNTSRDIGRILLEGVADDVELAKSALHYLGQRLYDDPAHWAIIREYLLLTGNAAHKTTPEHVSAYIRIKEEMITKDKASHPDFKALLENVLLGKPLNDMTLLGHLVDDLSDLYQGVLIGAPEQDPVEPADVSVHLPPFVEGASQMLLAHFPLLRRVTLRNYDDIAAVVELDGLVRRLAPEYKAQLHESIERQVHGEGPDMTASELLVHAKLAYVVSRGVAAQAPYVSRKHWSDSDIESSTIAAIKGMMKAPVRGEDEIEAHEQAMYLRYSYHDPIAYMRYESRNNDRYNDREIYEKRDLKEQISRVIESSPRALRVGEDALLRKLLRAQEPKKRSVFYWKEFLQQHDVALPSATLFLSYMGGLDIEAQHEHGETPVIERATITRFKALGDSERSLDHPFSYPIGDYGGLINGLLATYVNNTLLPQLKQYGAMNWSSPVLFCDDYSPQDRAMAVDLLAEYPVFSEIPPTTPDDIANGMVLQLLQLHTGKRSLDTTATLSQNLLLRQLHSLGGR